MKTPSEVHPYQKVVDHDAFRASVIVLVCMIARFLLFSNAAQRAMHPDQNWVFSASRSFPY